MKTIDHALELRGRIFGALELAEQEEDAVAQGPLLTFVVVGAGPTGVELAGQLAELSRHSLRGNFRRIDPAAARVILLDAAPADPARPSRRRFSGVPRRTCAGWASRSTQARGSRASTPTGSKPDARDRRCAAHRSRNEDLGSRR